MLLFIYLVVGQILQQIRLLQKQIEWLNYSYKECKGIGIKKGMIWMSLVNLRLLVLDLVKKISPKP